MVDASARHGHDADDGLRRFRESHDPGEQHLAEGRRQTTIGGILAGPEQFLDEERIAVRAPMDLGDEIVVRRCPEDRRQERRRLARVEAMKVEAFDPPASLEFGQPRQERVAPMKLVRTEGHDQHDPIGAQVPDEEGDGLARRRVGPMQILDDEQDRGRLRQSLEDARERRRAGGPGAIRSGCVRRLRLGRAERRHESRQLWSGAEPRTASSSSASSDRARVRSASTIGPYGTPPSPMSAQPPSSTRIPRPMAISVAARTSRDFPTPASPATSWWIGVPAAALSSARATASSSVARPTSVGLTRRRDIAR